MTSSVLQLTLTLVLVLGSTTATFDVNVTLQSCSSQFVVIHIEDATYGGLVYILGRGPQCRKTINVAPSDYEFSVKDCQLMFDQKFRVVVQKHPDYQTGYDKVIPMMCVLDTADLKVTGVIYPQEKLDVGVNMTIRPTAKMRILRDSEEVSDGIVSLNQKLKLTLSLDEPYRVDFDLKAKDCFASVIKIVKDECAVDEDMFPNFQKVSRGDLSNTFSAFQPTDLTGGYQSDVAFRCRVAVCKQDCAETICGQIIGRGRKKRNPEWTEDEIETLTVGTTLRVVSPAKGDLQGLPEGICMDKSLFAVVVALLTVVLLISWLVCGLALTKRDGVSGPADIDVTKSIGRRLSTMLNLPTAYNLKDGGKVHCIPESSPTFPRRQSVSVSMGQNEGIYSEIKLYRHEVGVQTDGLCRCMEFIEFDSLYEDNDCDTDSVESATTCASYDLESTRPYSGLSFLHEYKKRVSLGISENVNNYSGIPDKPLLDQNEDKIKRQLLRSSSKSESLSDSINERSDTDADDNNLGRSNSIKYDKYNKGLHGNDLENITENIRKKCADIVPESTVDRTETGESFKTSTLNPGSYIKRRQRADSGSKVEKTDESLRNGSNMKELPLICTETSIHKLGKLRKHLSTQSLIGNIEKPCDWKRSHSLHKRPVMSIVKHSTENEDTINTVSRPRSRSTGDTGPKMTPTCVSKGEIVAVSVSPVEQKEVEYMSSESSVTVEGKQKNEDRTWI